MISLGGESAANYRILLEEYHRLIRRPSCLFGREREELVARMDQAWQRLSPLEQIVVLEIAEDIYWRFLREQT